MHHPLGGGGRNIALSLVRRPRNLRREQRPFVIDLAEAQRVVELEDANSQREGTAGVSRPEEAAAVVDEYGRTTPERR